MCGFDRTSHVRFSAMPSTCDPWPRTDSAFSAVTIHAMLCFNMTYICLSHLSHLITLITSYHTYHILSHISHYTVDTVDTVAVRECYVWSQSGVTDECPHGHQSPSPKPGRWAQFPPAVPRNWHSWHCEMLRDHGEMALIVALNGIFMGYCWDINGILLWTYMNIY